MAIGTNPHNMESGPADQLPICDPQGIAPLATVLTEEKVMEIASLCIKDALAKADLIAHAADAENWSEVAVCAHDVKSTAGQIGALRLQDLATQLERNCKIEGGSDAHVLAAAFLEAARLTAATYDADHILEIISLAKT